MKEYSDFPPSKYFMRVLKSCPKSAFLYVQIWKNKQKNIFLVKKKEIRKDYMISPTVFKNLLLPLMFLNLIHVIENDENFEIDMFGAQSNE